MSEADHDLARHVAKLWPHRKHESPALTAYLCAVGFHRWRQLNLAELFPGRKIDHCFWCSNVRIDGVIYKV